MVSDDEVFIGKRVCFAKKESMPNLRALHR
jgi:hypothetical protein